MVAIADDITEVREARRRELKACMTVKGADEVEALRVAVEAAREVQMEREDLLPAEVLLRKLEGQYQPLTFSDVPRAEMERLHAASSREQAITILMQCFRLSLDAGFLVEVLVEFHYHNYAFCQRSRLCAEKASTLLSILNAIMKDAVAVDKPIEQARSFFDTLLKRHSRQLPPYSVGVFSAQEVELVKEYAERTLFRHYRMYLFVHSRKSDLHVRTVPQRTAGALVEPADLLVRHEMDPRDVPELEDLFRDPAAEAAAEAAAAAEAQRLADEAAASADAPAGDSKEQQVSAAIDAAMAEHLGDFEARLGIGATAPGAGS